MDKLYYTQPVNNGEWISVKERLPDKNDYYICIYIDDESDRMTDIMFYNKGIRKFIGRLEVGDAMYGDEVTHWMPIPSLPEEP